jgi:hypothetical protein
MTPLLAFVDLSASALRTPLAFYKVHCVDRQRGWPGLSVFLVYNLEVRMRA